MKFRVLLLIFELAIWSNAQDNLKILRIDSPPKIDGILSVDEWKNSTKTELFYQKEPQENDKPTERTEVFLAFDKENLYIAFHAFDSDLSGIRSPISKRDAVSNDDYVSIWLDTYDDRRRAYAFRFNPLGVQEDGIFTVAELGNLSWDGILESKGNLTKDGYIVEIAIPFKSLRFQINDKKTWGLHLFRWIARKAERSTWAKTSLANPNLFSQMGTMEGVSDIFSGRTLDIIPTVTLSNNSERELQNGVPKLNNVNRIDPGMTINYSLSPNVTLSATVNPDFSQIENDVPQVSVNQRFPLFFPERRPFFLEGAEVFRGVYDDAPKIIDTRQIVDLDWGIKLTGKFGKNSLGFLSASDRSAGLRGSPKDANFGKNAQFNIVRYSRDVLNNSNIGFSLTDRRFADSKNTVGTIDARFQINQSNLFAVQASHSKTTDLGGRKRDGGAIYAVYNFENLKWDLSTSFSSINKNFTAQSGFIRRTGFDRVESVGGRTFRPKEKSWWTRIRPSFYTAVLRDLNGKIDESYFDPTIVLDFSRGITTETYYSFRRDNFLVQSYVTGAFVSYFTINALKRIAFDGNIEIGTGVNFDSQNPQIGRLFNNKLTVTLRPVSKINSEIIWLKSSLRSRISEDYLFKQDIFRNKTTYQFNRFNSVRSIIDYDTLERRIGLSFLYSYTPRPSTAVYLGYGDLIYNKIEPLNGNRIRGLIRQSRSLFAKFSYNFRF